MKLNLFEKAIKWFDEGLAVSFDSIFYSDGAKSKQNQRLGGGKGWGVGGSR